MLEGPPKEKEVDYIREIYGAVNTINTNLNTFAGDLETARVELQGGLHELGECLDLQNERISKLDESVRGHNQFNGRLTPLEAWMQDAKPKLRLICWVLGIATAAAIVAVVGLMVTLAFGG